MYGFIMNGINGIYKKLKIKGLNWFLGCFFMVQMEYCFMCMKLELQKV